MAERRRHPLGRRALGVAALAACLMSTATAAAAEPMRPEGVRVREQVEQVLSDPRFQRVRPNGSLPVEEPEPAPFELPDFAPSDFKPSAASGVSEALLWVLLGVFGAAVLAVLVREGMRYASQRKRRPKKKRAGGAQDALLDLSQLALERLPASLARARQLAAEGRFEEAVHMLLEGALGYLHALADFSLEPAFTSREVLARAPLTSETRHAFKDLVMTVEVSLFGGLPVDGSDFGRCESSFVTLHQRLGGTLGD